VGNGVLFQRLPQLVLLYVVVVWGGGMGSSLPGGAFISASARPTRGARTIFSCYDSCHSYHNSDCWKAVICLILCCTLGLHASLFDQLHLLSECFNPLVFFSWIIQCQ
jgi:hypothetical protein